MKPQCFCCGADDHMISDCPEKKVCSLCGRDGHSSSTCKDLICFRCCGPHRTRECGKPEEKTISTKDDFLSTILSWKIRDFTNESLLKSSINPIPSQFYSATEWFDCFRPFIFEELRSQLHNTIISSDFEDNHVLGIESIVYRSKAENTLQKSIVTFQIKSDDDQAVLNNLTGTLGLLVSNCPLVLSLAAVKSTIHSLVAIRFPERKRDPEDIPMNIFEVEFMYDVIFHPQNLMDTRKLSLIVLDVGTITYERIMSSLNIKRVPSFMPDILRGQYDTSRSATRPIGNIKNCDEFIGSLNDSQKDVVESVLSVGGVGTAGIQLVKGPPGIIMMM